MKKSSRLSGFYQLSRPERARIVAAWADLSSEEQAALAAGLSLEQADYMIENVIGLFALPLGIATNFCINDEDILVPMAVEEPSIVAAVSFAARLARAGGGFRTGSTFGQQFGRFGVGADDIEQENFLKGFMAAVKGGNCSTCPTMIWPRRRCRRPRPTFWPSPTACIRASRPAGAARGGWRCGRWRIRRPARC